MITSVINRNKSSICAQKKVIIKIYKFWKSNPEIFWKNWIKIQPKWMIINSSTKRSNKWSKHTKQKQQDQTSIKLWLNTWRFSIQLFMDSTKANRHSSRSKKKKMHILKINCKDWDKITINAAMSCDIPLIRIYYHQMGNYCEK